MVHLWIYLDGDYQRVDVGNRCDGFYKQRGLRIYTCKGLQEGKSNGMLLEFNHKLQAYNLPRPSKVLENV